jgi:hypothetical protein
MTDHLPGKAIHPWTRSGKTASLRKRQPNEKRHCAKHSAFIVISEINASVDSQIMAEWTGLEPATPGVTGRYSNQLNYHSW